MRKINKKKLLIVLVILNILSIGIGTTYSAYKNIGSGNVDLSGIAKIVFNNQIVSSLTITSNEFIPGNSGEYTFKVGNYLNGVRSEVNIDYSIDIETFHFLPIVVKLYKIENNIDTLVLTCDENTGTRNDDNKLICSSTTNTLLYSSNNEDNYKLVIEFEDSDGEGNLWGEEYSGIIDYVKVSINSKQKTN